MKISKMAILLSMALVFGGQLSFGQALRNGLGEADTIVSPNKTFNSTGNANEIGNFSAGSSEQDTGAFFTRHRRSGNASGIGGSFLGTTNVTAESSPARRGRIPETTVRALIPTQGVHVAPTRSFSESLAEPISTALPELSPDLSSRWNPALPSYSDSLFSSSPSSIDFFAGHKASPASKTFSNTFGVPSFDSFEQNPFRKNSF